MTDAEGDTVRRFFHYQHVGIKNLSPVANTEDCIFISCFDPRIQGTILALKERLYPSCRLYPVTLPAAIKVLNTQPDYFFSCILDIAIVKLQVRDIVLVTHLDCKGYGLDLGLEAQVKHHANELISAYKLLVNQYGGMNITSICVPSLPESTEPISEVVVVEGYSTSMYQNLF